MTNKITEDDWNEACSGHDYGVLYQYLRASDASRDIIEKKCYATKHHNKETVFSFTGTNLFPSVFGLSQTSQSVFKELVKNEKDECSIRAVHSSELLCNLCFSDLTTSPFRLTGPDGIQRIFNKSYSEWPNHALTSIDPSREQQPSRLDALLISDDRKVALAIECKFGEYLYDGNTPTTFKTYMKLLGLLDQEKAMEKMAKIDGNYIEIAKQIFAHSYGLRNLYRQATIRPLVFDQERQKKFSDLENIFYAEVVFDFGSLGETRLNAFRTFYKKAAELLNSQNLKAERGEGKKSIPITYLPEIITYQDLFSKDSNGATLTSATRKFYRFDD